jgi:predicted AlkP superfamily pyrophosphatase or phosphodiesterase
MRTVTKPQHATMLTGLLADDHGVFSNKNYQLIPDGVTVYEKIELNDSSIRTAHISSKPANFGESTFGNILEDVDYFFAEDKPAPRAAANQARRRIYEWHEQDFFIVAHFNQPDVKGHKHGVNSRKYEEAILRCDAELGRILQKLDSYGILQETTIYILSDHGFGSPRPKNHKDAPNTFIISNDSDTEDIFMVEVADLLLSNFGFEPRQE